MVDMENLLTDAKIVCSVHSVNGYCTNFMAGRRKEISRADNLE